MDFASRVSALPRLGLGVSTEYGAGDTSRGLDIPELRRTAPQYANFLEIGIETLSGLDRHARAWLAEGLPTTYHFLDVNLDDPADLDPGWLGEVRRIAAELEPAWMCGDAGVWHFGNREPGHMLLLPPILSDASASTMADGIRRLRDAVRLEVFPENPPGAVFLGDLHLLEFFARVCERADTGMLLDCAHLAIYQRAAGHDPLQWLDRFPLERVVELHVAGGQMKEFEGWRYIEDDHSPAVLDDTWLILDHVLPRAPNLKAVVFECERNPLAQALPGFARLEQALRASPSLGATSTSRS